jgi:hypothetical protein
MRPAHPWLGLACLIALATMAAGQEHPVRPYVAPAQLDVPWPKHSHVKQPWRAFLETRSGDAFVRGVGVNYNPPGNDAVAVRLLAEAGFRAFRIEVGWGAMRWDEDGLTTEPRLREVLRLCHRYHVRPTLLLNAHQGVPCPVRAFSRRLVDDAPRGSRAVRLTGPDGVVAGRTGLSNLSTYWGAEALITDVDAATGTCRLSKPLPKDQKAGSDVPLATLKYLPLYPVGTREFDETAAGWVRYALLVCRLARDAGIEDFDVEIWNELTFGTKFLDVNNYHEHALARSQKDALHEGGTCWELARRTVEAVHREYPGVRCIWGFSNTTFFHTAVEQLPPGTDGQSYHPYGTGTRRLPEQEYHRDRPGENIDGFTPSTDIRLPEGHAITFIQTESLMRLLNPEARGRRPPGTKRFYHYITEHGVAPPEDGIRGEAGAWELKAKCALRSFCAYLNKGVDVLHYFGAYDRAATGMGLLPPDLPRLAGDATFEQVATPPLKAIRNLTRPFADSVPLKETRPLDAEVVALGEQVQMFDGDGTRPTLWHRDAFAFLPFQVKEGKYVIAVYVVTYDATRPMAEERYRLRIRGLPTVPGAVRLYDPLRDQEIPVRVLGKEGGVVELEVAVVDCPRLLVLGR